MDGTDETPPRLLPARCAAAASGLLIGIERIGQIVLDNRSLRELKVLVTTGMRRQGQPTISRRVIFFHHEVCRDALAQTAIRRGLAATYFRVSAEARYRSSDSTSAASATVSAISCRKSSR